MTYTGITCKGMNYFLQFLYYPLVLHSTFLIACSLHNYYIIIILHNLSQHTYVYNAVELKTNTKWQEN